ncbi:MAG: HNH endonuclease [Opitutae bacterium]|nr:HNH endonuclease [Opitutae bacterium]
MVTLFPNNADGKLADIVETLRRLPHWGEWNARRGAGQDFRCVYCQCDLLASVNDYDSWQLDHIFPSSRGGPHDFENIAVCCRTCNLLKHDCPPSGSTREQRIDDARKHIQVRRMAKMDELEKLRILIHYAPGGGNPQ